MNQSCPTGKGQLDCLRTKDGFSLQKILLSSGNQFQPVIDNITVFKDYVKQTKEGRTARVPLLIGTVVAGSKAEVRNARRAATKLERLGRDLQSQLRQAEPGAVG